ncbi:MAG: nitrogenase [Clostridia bacterium]|nr:nitrogenase [Clostridia bacterium]
MLKRIQAAQAVGVKIKDAGFPSPFPAGLEYSAPARGTWNIVHTGMLIPGAHEIFVCAQGCLRGVVLTAAEMNAQDRFSMIAIKENNVLEGDMEELIIDGVTDILHRLPQQPPAVLIYTSCIHHFLVTNLKRVYKILRERFPQIDFTDCYMNPIMRKSGLNPDQLMRRQLYAALTPLPLDPRAVNIIGNDLPTLASSEFVQLIKNAGYTLRDITTVKSYAEYKQMAASAVNLTYNPAAVPAGDTLARRMGAVHYYLPASYDLDEIEATLHRLAEILHTDCPDVAPLRQQADQALRETKALLGNTPVAIDYTATFRPLSLARLLLRYGVQVKTVYADGFLAEEASDFESIRTLCPSLMLYPTAHAAMRFARPQASQERILAIGQKAAYFTASRHFVNVVETGGMLGFDGIVRLCGLIQDAYMHEKDTKSLIQIKGLGCGCCF